MILSLGRRRDGDAVRFGSAGPVLFGLPAGQGEAGQQRIERGEIDPTRVITHRLPLQDAPRGYDIFKHKQDNCEKVVLKP